MSGPKTDKIWAAAVRRAVLRRLENVDGKPRKLERLADKLIDFAMDGQGWAFKEIGERLDGKPPQAVDVTSDGDKVNLPSVIVLKAAGD